MKENYVFIDIRTTGFNPILDKICYIALTKFNSELKPMRTFSTWVDPEIGMKVEAEKRLGITAEELKEFPPFRENMKIIKSFLKDATIGTFEYSRYSVLEFLREEFFMEEVKFDYKKRDLIFVKEVEDAIFKRDIKNLMFKYYGKKVREKEEYTKEMGEIFKAQMELLKTTPQEFNYADFVKKDVMELIDKYLYEVDGVLYLNFGKHIDKDLKDVPKQYIEWILDADFTLQIKERIREYLNIDYGR